MRISNKQKKANTDALFAFFAAERARAEAEPVGSREITLKVTAQAEWSVTFTILRHAPMGEMYDCVRIATHADTLVAAVRAKYSLSSSPSTGGGL